MLQEALLAESLPSAQRLSASEVFSQRLPDQGSDHQYVLNALRHQRCSHAQCSHGIIGRPMCSTPCDIRGVITPHSF